MQRAVGQDTPGARRGTSDLRLATVVELRKVSGSAARWMLVAAVVLAVVTAVVIAGTTPPQKRTFAILSFFVQSSISLPLPFASILLMTYDFGKRAKVGHSPAGAAGLVAAKLVASTVIALFGAAFGIALSALVSRVAAPDLDTRWQGAGLVVLGSFVVQLVAQLCGAGFGLLIRSSLTAIIVDVVLPLGLWVVTGAVPALHVLRDWLTPFASVAHLTSGEMNVRHWAEVAVVVLVWVVALNLLALRRLRRSA
jgi:hypothetical protein